MWTHFQSAGHTDIASRRRTDLQNNEQTMVKRILDFHVVFWAESFLPLCIGAFCDSVLCTQLLHFCFGPFCCGPVSGHWRSTLPWTEESSCVIYSAPDCIEHFVSTPNNTCLSFQDRICKLTNSFVNGNVDHRWSWFICHFQRCRSRKNLCRYVKGPRNVACISSVR